MTDADAFERTTLDVLMSIEQTQEVILAELKCLRAAQPSTSRSSVELTENAKGVVQIAVKTYVDSPPIDDACTEAVAAFATLKQEIQRGETDKWRTVETDREQMEQWRRTVDDLKKRITL